MFHDFYGKYLLVYIVFLQLHAEKIFSTSVKFVLFLLAKRWLKMRLNYFLLFFLILLFKKLSTKNSIDLSIYFILSSFFVIY